MPEQNLNKKNAHFEYWIGIQCILYILIQHNNLAKVARFWQTFLNFGLASGPQLGGWGPEASTNSKKSANGN